MENKSLYPTDIPLLQSGFPLSGIITDYLNHSYSTHTGHLPVPGLPLWVQSQAGMFEESDSGMRHKANERLCQTICRPPGRALILF